VRPMGGYVKSGCLAVEIVLGRGYCVLAGIFNGYLVASVSF
jgi:hypothetical protein